jgi:nitrous oxidase accessory protein NosD
MAEPHPLIGTKPTLRKGTGDVYKYDFTEKHIEKLIAAQTALKITIHTPIVQVVEFINRQIPVEKEPSE